MYKAKTNIFSRLYYDTFLCKKINFWDNFCLLHQDPHPSCGSRGVVDDVSCIMYHEWRVTEMTLWRWRVRKNHVCPAVGGYFRRFALKQVDRLTWTHWKNMKIKTLKLKTKSSTIDSLTLTRWTIIALCPAAKLHCQTIWLQCAVFHHPLKTPNYSVPFSLSPLFPFLEFSPSPPPPYPPRMFINFKARQTGKLAAPKRRAKAAPAESNTETNSI